MGLALCLAILHLVTNTQIFDGGLDVDFSVTGASASMLQVGRYPLSILNSIFGLGGALHIPAAGGRDPSVYGMRGGTFRFTSHLDSAYATVFTPLGVAKHYFTDVRDHGAHRRQC
jgi:hypothetical protein